MAWAHTRSGTTQTIGHNQDEVNLPAHACTLGKFEKFVAIGLE